MSTVYVRKASYDQDRLAGLIPEMIDESHPDLIKPGDRVLIKPNFLVPAKPEQAILTHPLIVASVARYAIDRGGVPLVADSSAFGSFEKLIRQGGFEAALSEMDVTLRPFEESVTVDIGEPFGRIELAKDAVDADVIINLPKLKTHSQMLLTLAVKNLFGTVVGWRKPRWHLKAGVDRELFAQLLVGICRTVKPAVSILDGITALEGHGPGKRGKPKQLGVLMAGNDPFAIDVAVCRMLGIDPQQLPTHAAAFKPGNESVSVDINGDLPDISDFDLPVLGNLTLGPPSVQGFMRKHLVQRPVAEADRCRLCGQCGEICPASAIACSESGLRFDYDRCIRCYCCIEICPYGAIAATDTRLGRAAKRLLGWGADNVRTGGAKR